MPVRYFILLLLLCCSACNSGHGEQSANETTVQEAGTGFNKTKWRIKEGPDYPYRDQMVDSVLYNDTIRSLDTDEIFDLLGKPDRRYEGYWYYLISQRRLGSWTLHTKTLVFKFNADSTVDWIKLHE